MKQEPKNPPEDHQTKPPVKKNRKHLTTREKKRFAKELIKHNNNKTTAYQAIRPDTTDNTAKVQGYKLLDDLTVKLELHKALENNDITPDYIITNYKRAIESGLGKKATNKDALTGLKDLAQLSNLSGKDEIEASERHDLELYSHNELLEQLDNLAKDIKQLKTMGAIEAEIIDP